MELPRPQTVWVGVDVGKTHHWVCAIDADGRSLLSTKVGNDEAEILAVLAAVTGLADQSVWAVDIIGRPVGAAVGVAGPGRAAGALRLWAGGVGDEFGVHRGR